MSSDGAATDLFVLPASFAQVRLWLIEEATPGQSTYNLPVALQLLGPIDLDALQTALDSVVTRQESLRTTFEVEGGDVVQVIHPPGPFPLEIVALDANADVRTSVNAEANRPFDLRRGPLFRCTLFRIAPDDHALLINVHHIVADGWSTTLLRHEIAEAYSAAHEGRASILPELTLQYADYAVWQREQLSGEPLERLEAYWRKQLRGPLPVLELPMRSVRAAGSSARPAERVGFRIPAALTDGLEAFAREERATSFMVYLAAFQLMLSRYAGQDDVIVGTPMAGRSSPELEPVVGLFLNTLALRTDLSGRPTFRTLLARARETAIGAFAHDALPFERVVDLTRSGRDNGRSPLFQVLFSLENSRTTAATTGTIGAGEFAGLTVEPLGAALDSAKFDLQFTLAPQESGWRGSINYDASLFDRDTIDRMASHFVTLLNAIGTDPDQQIGALPLLDATERRLMVDSFNDTAVPYPAETTLLDLIETQAKRTPDAVAVSDSIGAWNHGELHRRADAIGRWLRARGVGPGSLVAVCMERSCDLLAALVGVLKAGAAYVPIDPEYPADRIAFMLADCGAAVLLTQERIAPTLPVYSGETLAVDRSWPELLALAPVPGVAATAADPAYMIYTSGSTGRPKGAINSHRGIVNRLRWMQDEYQLTPDDAVLQKTPASFDVSVWEFFWPLMSGARLVMAEPGGHRDPVYLAQVIRRERITVLHFVPSMLAVFLDVGTHGEQCASLRDVICSGEALPASLANRFHVAIPDARLHNLYGPTEAAVDVSHFTCRPDETGITVPIGRPIANTQLYVLDPLGQPVPIGIPGELYIGGVQVGMGYHNRPDLTAERFVPDPFSSAPASRLYRTGDRVRWLGDGTLEYLGRFDFQVKLRGQRIELGEIEAALEQQPGVTSAVVVVREDSPGDARLVGYVTVASSAPYRESDVREALRQHLPSYMVPATIVVLEALPLSPNGKLDRKALPAPAYDGQQASGSYAAPRSVLEHEITDIWQELLGVPRVGVHDDFFDLGGSSLLAIKMISRVEPLIERTFPFRWLLEHPSIAEISALVSSEDSDAAEHHTPVLQANGPGTPLAFVHGDFLGFGWYCRRLAPLIGPAPLIVLPTQGPGPGAPQTIEAMALAQVARLRAVQPVGPYRIGGFCSGGLIAYEMARVLRAQGQSVECVVLVDAFYSNARSRWLEPLVRLAARSSDPEISIARRATIYDRLRYYRGRMRRMNRKPLGERLQWARSVIRRVLSAGPGPSPAAAPQSLIGIPNDGIPGDGLGPAGRHVARAQRGYMPGTYRGRIELIWASAAIPKGNAGSQFDGGWGRLVGQWGSHVIDGGHDDLVMREGLAALARTIRDVIAKESPAE